MNQPFILAILAFSWRSKIRRRQLTWEGCLLNSRLEDTPPNSRNWAQRKRESAIHPDFLSQRDGEAKLVR